VTRRSTKRCNLREQPNMTSPTSRTKYVGMQDYDEHSADSAALPLQIMQIAFIRQASFVQTETRVLLFVSRKE
jgi:hypothetical protein